MGGAYFNVLYVQIAPSCRVRSLLKQSRELRSIGDKQISRKILAKYLMKLFLIMFHRIGETVTNTQTSDEAVMIATVKTHASSQYE